MSVHRPRTAPWLRDSTRNAAGVASPEAGTDAEAWDRELSRFASPAPLNQAWAWGQVQARTGWRVDRLRFAGRAPVTVLVQGSGPMRWAFVPRGPVDSSAELLEMLAGWARSAGLARLRVEPEIGPDVRPLLLRLGFHRVADVQPSHTRILSLGSETDMLASLHRSTRYNIGYAEKRGVTVEMGSDAEELARHMAASAARAGVNLPGAPYIRLLLDSLPTSRTFVARHEGDSLCALLVAVHDGRAYYLYSGSNGLKRNLKAMNLAMWCAMRYAAEVGCRDFDLWGIAPDNDPTHPWHGFTEFKRGFGGRDVEYAGTWDLALSPAASLAIEARDVALKNLRRLRHHSSYRKALQRKVAKYLPA